MGAQGTIVLDFGSTPAQEATVSVTGQAGIVAGSHAEAFFMQDTTADNGLEEHQEAAAICPLVCGPVTPGVGFPILAQSLGPLGMGQFSVRWVWN